MHINYFPLPIERLISKFPKQHILLFITGWEIMSIPAYVTVAVNRKNDIEAGVGGHPATSISYFSIALVPIIPPESAHVVPAMWNLQHCFLHNMIQTGSKFSCPTHPGTQMPLL